MSVTDPIFCSCADSAGLYLLSKRERIGRREYEHFCVEGLVPVVGLEEAQEKRTAAVAVRLNCDP